MNKSIPNLKNCLGAVRTLAAQVASRNRRKLESKASHISKPRARPAMVLTTLTPEPQTDEAPVKKYVTKQDKALRKMAEEAEPGKCHTLHEIAKSMGVTRERVRQIEMRAKRNFRNRLSILLKSEGVTPSEIAAVVSAAHVE